MSDRQRIDESLEHYIHGEPTDRHPAAPPETRVVLVKPGDVLILGNVGEQRPENLDRLRELMENLDLANIVVFSEDIDIASAARATWGRKHV